MAIKKVLVPIDFSDGSLLALDYAIDLARSIRAELTILFVVEPVGSGAGGDLYSTAMDRSILFEERQRIGSEQLSLLGRRLGKRAIRFRTLVETGTPYRVIGEVAERLRANLIVMATHGRSGISHLLLGSVTEKVIRTAPCPVLTLRARAAFQPTRKRNKRTT
jgi:nucleotide-binding universal stress UspA family protein